MSDLFRDVLVALRQTFRSPRLALLCILLASTGTSLNSVAFTLVHSLILRPLPLRSPDRVVILFQGDKGGKARTLLTYGNYLGLQRQARFLQGVESIGNAPVLNIKVGGRHVILYAQSVSPRFFDWLGVQPAAGILSLDDENAALISEDLWRRHYQGSAQVIGMPLDAYTVVGVVPGELPLTGAAADVWVQGRPDRSEDDQGVADLFTVARLASGTTADALAAGLDEVAHQLRRRFPVQNEDLRFVAVPLLDSLVGDYRATLWLFQGLGTLVLAVAFFSLVNLMGADVRGREHLSWIRIALGASGGQAFRPFLVRSLLFSAAAAGCGLLLTFYSVQFLVANGPVELFQARSVRPGYQVYVFEVVQVVVLVVLASVLPCYRTILLKKQARPGHLGHPQTGERGSLSQLFLTAQVALSLVLTVSTTLLIVSLIRIYNVPLGFEPSNLMATFVQLPPDLYPNQTSKIDFFERLHQRLETVPGVSGSAHLLFLPLSQKRAVMPVSLRPPSSDGERAIAASVQPAGTGTNRVMGMRLEAGRWFGPEDSSVGWRVAVINRTLALQMGARARDAVGRGINMGEGWKTVIGVIEDVKTDALALPNRAEVYIPHQSSLFFAFGAHLLVRTDGSDSPRRIVPDLIRQMDARLNVQPFQDLQERVERNVGLRRFLMDVLIGMTLGCLVLAVLGVYALGSQITLSRLQEIGIRMTHGARARDVLGLILGRLAAPLGAGLVLGLAGALWFSRAIEEYLFQVRTTDFGYYLLSLVLVGSAALLAVLPPFIKARRFDLATLLRLE